MELKIMELVNNWPGDQDNFIEGPRLIHEDEVIRKVSDLGFNLVYTGNGYLLIIK